MPFDLYDGAGLLLAPRGHVLRAEDLTLLKHRAAGGFFFDTEGDADRAVKPAPPPRLVTLQTQATKRLDEQVSRFAANPPAAPRNAGPIPPRMPLSVLREQFDAESKRFHRDAERVAQILSDASAGAPPSMIESLRIVDDMRRLLGFDASLAGLLAELKSSDQNYLHYHGMRVAILMVAIATRLGYDEHDVRAAGIGALFADIGMLHVPESIRSSTGPLNDHQWMEIYRHPIYTVDVLVRSHGLSSLSLLLAYQHHERFDGSGYPRGVKRNSIHPLARLQAAVDTYVAATSVRPHRDDQAPYDAMTMLLHRVNARVLDPAAVRAVLDHLSLFPIGSFVKLSDGSKARVMRATPQRHTQPVVVLLSENGKETDQEIDLSRSRHLHVTQVIKTPHTIESKVA